MKELFQIKRVKKKNKKERKTQSTAMFNPETGYWIEGHVVAIKSMTEKLENFK